MSVINGTNVNGLASSLIVTTRRIPASTTCTTSPAGTGTAAPVGGALNPDSTKSVALSSDTFTASPSSTTGVTYCLDVKLDPNAPQSVSGGAVQFLVTYTATQS